MVFQPDEESELSSQLHEGSVELRPKSVAQDEENGPRGRGVAVQARASSSTHLWRSRAITAIGVVGAIAGVLSVAQFATRNTSGFDTLEFSAAPAEGVATSWAVEVDLLDEFPTSDAACGAAQQQWLSAHATPVERQIVVSMRNTASEGAQLALSRFAAETEESDDGSPIRVLVVCDPVPGAATPRQFARLDTESGGAMYVRPVTQGQQPEAEVPIVWNLAPGELGTVTFHLFSDGAVTGTLNVDVTSRGETRQVQIEGSEFTLPALLMGGDVMLFADATGLRCEQYIQSVVVPCTLDGVRSAAARDN